MVKRINFGDDIFFLAMKVKYLTDAGNLELSPGYYRKNLSEELIFLSTTITKIYKDLKDSSFAIKRAEYLKNLLRLQRSFADLLDAILSGKSGYASLLEEHRERLTGVAASLRSNIEELYRFLISIGEEHLEGKGIISEEEYRYLLSEEEG
jgi:hypothetical protein